MSFKKPKSAKREHHTIRPDLSNLAKGVEDALNGIVWKDDSQIIELILRKQYRATPGIEVIVSTFDEMIGA